MTGRDFLTLANQLAAGTTAAEWRTAISRAYYAVFHVARDLLDSLRFVVPHEDKAHTFLYHRLNNCGAPLVENEAKHLHDLRRWRNQADYDLYLNITQPDANRLIVVSEQIIQTLENLTSSEQIQIRDAMIIYERDVLQNVTWHP